MEAEKLRAIFTKNPRLLQFSITRYKLKVDFRP